MASLVSCSKVFKQLALLLLKLFQKTEERETLPVLLSELSITPKPRPSKDIIKRENYRPYLINIDAKILNKILVILMQQHIKGSYTMAKLYLS